MRKHMRMTSTCVCVCVCVLQVALMHLEAWISSIGISRTIAKYLPQSQASPEDPFGAVRQMTDAQVEIACATALSEITSVLKQSIRELRTKHVDEEPDDVAYEEMMKSKYEMCGDEWASGSDHAGVASFGKLEEFYKGLDYHLGLPNPDVLRAMADEHTKRPDSEDEFTTPNYESTITTPATEWEFVTNPQSEKVYPGRMREPEPLSKFVNHPMAKKADLNEAEITAMRLYTGPMYQK